VAVAGEIPDHVVGEQAEDGGVVAPAESLEVGVDGVLVSRHQSSSSSSSKAA
jgi:hypothetical protein